MHVGVILGLILHHFGTCGIHFGSTGHHCGTPGQQVAVWGAHVSNLMIFWLVSGPMWGSPFSPLGVTISFPGVWNGENSVFCGQPDSRSDFGTKSD